MPPHESSKLTAKNSGKEAKRFDSSMPFQLLSGFKVDKGVGYMYVYSPSHELSNGSGKVYEHKYVMCQWIGRDIEVGECIHHIDRDKTNNSIENLMLMSIEDHAKLHQLEDFGNIGMILKMECYNCGLTFSFDSLEKDNRKYCSSKCSSESLMRFNPEKDELRELVWKLPMIKVAELYGVSDNSVKKRCVKLGIDRPPKGFFLRKNA